MNSSRFIYKGKIKDSNLTQKSGEGWIKGFYYQKEINGVVRHYIIDSHGEEYEVISDSVYHGTNLMIPNLNGEECQVFEGDIIAIHTEKWGWDEYVVGWDTKVFQLGVCPVFIYLNDRQGAWDGFLGRELRVSLVKHFVRYLPYHIYDLVQEYLTDEHPYPWYTIHETTKSIVIPENWEPIIKM